MVKKKNIKYWLLGFTLASVGVIGFFLYVYKSGSQEFKLPKFSWLEIALTFCIGFFPSVISRIVANIKTEQVKPNINGIVDSFRDATYGWIVYYSLFVIAFVLYDYIIFREIPAIF